MLCILLMAPLLSVEVPIDPNVVSAQNVSLVKFAFFPQVLATKTLPGLTVQQLEIRTPSSLERDQ